MGIHECKTTHQKLINKYKTIDGLIRYLQLYIDCSKEEIDGQIRKINEFYH